MNTIAIHQEPAHRGVVADMADRFGMVSEAFERTLRATVFPHDAPREEFAAFLLVAREYNLNPITREIYAFPKKGGGIVPVVSIDGWIKLLNSHPAFDGMDFEEQHDKDGKLFSIRCTIFRKDRTHPISVAEFLSECRRPTDPWKMEHRMLRHKAAIQCARYAFGFAGIYDPDEAAVIAGNAELQPPAPPSRPQVATAIEFLPSVQERAEAALDAAERPQPPIPPKPPAPSRAAPKQAPSLDPETIRTDLVEALAAARTREDAYEAFNDLVKPRLEMLFPPDREELADLTERRALELSQ